MANIDEIDRKLLKILEMNSRTPFTEIANELDMSESTVRSRISRLEEKGVIRRYTTEIDPIKIGYKTITLLGVDTDPEDYLAAIQELKKFKEVKWVAKSTGDHMIMAEVWTKSGEDLQNLLSKKIASVPGVKRLCPAILLEKVK